MTRSRSIALPAAAAAAAALALAALALALFGSAVATATPDATSSRTATVKIAHRSLGKILVDSRGRTLYVLSADPAGKSKCFGACATNWPPLRVSGKPTVGTGLKASKVGTIARRDGRRQVTYNRHPLYRFVGDARVGQTKGQGIVAFGGRWSVVSPAGRPISH
jgi:predicted lipoprotein with Yx(FWY)xxD motif